MTLSHAVMSGAVVSEIGKGRYTEGDAESFIMSIGNQSICELACKRLMVGHPSVSS